MDIDAANLLVQGFTGLAAWMTGTMLGGILVISGATIIWAVPSWFVEENFKIEKRQRYKVITFALSMIILPASIATLGAALYAWGMVAQALHDWLVNHTIAMAIGWGGLLALAAETYFYEELTTEKASEIIARARARAKE